MKSTMLPAVLAGILLLGAGCATQIRKPDAPAAPPSTRFSEFSAFVLAPIEIAPAYAGAEANKKAARKIEESLFRHASAALPGLQKAAEAPGETGARTLRIEPRILEIKFIGGAARFWVGAMAGSSAVLMRVDFVDAGSGEVVSNPEFYRSASAFAGGPPGLTDNLMLDEVAREIAQYIQFNR